MTPSISVLVFARRSTEIALVLTTSMGSDRMVRIGPEMISRLSYYYSTVLEFLGVAFFPQCERISLIHNLFAQIATRPQRIPPVPLLRLLRTIIYSTGRSACLSQRIALSSVRWDTHHPIPFS
eukprot:COSAG02_NODE_79_length_40228_cov_18.435762_23_plen_123_part_00